MKLPIAALAACLLFGCVADNSPRPAPRPTPESARPGKLVLATSGAFQDSNGNQYRDTSTLVVYIFGESKYPLPMKPKGQFEVRLEDRTGVTIASWQFTMDQTTSAIRDMPSGPGFVFELDLRKSAAAGFSDKINKGEASMVVTFKPEGAGGEGTEPITARTSSPILIGPIERAR